MTYHKTVILSSNFPILNSFYFSLEDLWHSTESF